MWWIAQNMLVSALLAAAVAVLCRVRRLSPAMKHALWLLVLVKLVTPPVAYYRLPRSVERLVAAWSFETSAINERPDGEGATAFAEAAEFARDTDGVAENGMGDPVFYAAESPDISTDSLTTSIVPNRRPEPAAKSTHSRFELVSDEGDGTTAISDAVAQRAGMLAFVVWLLGSASLATLHMVRLVRLWRLTRQSTPTPVWLDQLVRDASERLRVRSPVLTVVPRACSPLVFALGRSRLIWPTALNEQLTRQQQEAVLLHELAHLRRRDHWVAWLELAAGWLWWFNPIYWYARQQLREYAELACDAWVVGLLPAGRRTYAQALIEVTEFISTAPAALPAVAMGNVARSSLERRLTMILRERISYRVPLAGAVVIGLSLLAVLPGWSHGQAPDLVVGAPGGASEGAPAAEPAIAKSADVVPGTAQTADERDVTAPVETAADPSAPTRAVEVEADLGFPIVAANDQPAEAQPDVATEPADGDEERIAALEAKLAGLLAEVQALRGANGSPGQKGARRGVGGPMMGPMGMGPGPMGPGPMGPGGGMGMGGPMGPGGGGGPMGSGGMGMGNPMGPGGPAKPKAGIRPAKTKATYTRVERIGPNIDPSRPHLPADIETLTRARYKLPAATAEALASFIGKYVDAHLDASTDGETLTVTASQEDQLRIASFIELLRERPDQPGRLPRAKAHRAADDAPSADESNDELRLEGRK